MKYNRLAESNWLAAELHLHTKHSDGHSSLMEMAQAAKNNGISVIALTDHNTISGHEEIDEVYNSTGIYIIKGIEHTTFFGHVLNFPLREYIDWRQLNRFNLSTLLDKAHAQKAIVGLAHPFRFGGVICTGCHMDYEVDYNKIDYIEVWSREFPSVSAYENEPTFTFWDSLLNKGYRIMGLSGRDWHHIPDTENLPLSRTFIRFDEKPNIDNVGDLAAYAIKKGQVSVSMAHCIDARYKNGEMTVSLLDFGFYDVSKLFIRLMSNCGELLKTEISEYKPLVYKVDPTAVWIRAELHGHICEEEAMIGFSNPCWIK